MSGSRVAVARVAAVFLDAAAATVEKVCNTPVDSAGQHAHRDVLTLTINRKAQQSLLEAAAAPGVRDS